MRSITLTIFALENQEMQDVFSLLPFAAFYANLASHLREIWMDIEAKIKEITPQDEGKMMDVVLKQIEDQNETLFYMQDLLEITQ